MTRTKRLALAFYVGAVLAGATVGITLDRWLLREQLVREWNNPRAARERLADELGLDATQPTALDTILDGRNRSYDALMAPIRPQVDSLQAQARAQVRQLLTPEQLAIYDRMQAEREAARRQEKKQ